MKKKSAFVFLLLLYILSISTTSGAADVKMAFTVSMDEPNSHTYQVVLQCEGISEETVNLKMPAFTPGYYRILDFAKNVREFSAEDKSGKPLGWAKTGDNEWQIKWQYC